MEEMGVLNIFPFSQPNCFKDLGRSAMIWVWNGGL
jgi:hypothetical protein